MARKSRYSNYDLSPLFSNFIPEITDYSEEFTCLNFLREEHSDSEVEDVLDMFGLQDCELYFVAWNREVDYFNSTDDRIYYKKKVILFSSIGISISYDDAISDYTETVPWGDIDNLVPWGYKKDALSIRVNGQPIMINGDSLRFSYKELSGLLMNN